MVFERTRMKSLGIPIDRICGEEFIIYHLYGPIDDYAKDGGPGVV